MYQIRGKINQENKNRIQELFKKDVEIYPLS
jgi:hypothetical protein